MLPHEQQKKLLETYQRAWWNYRKNFWLWSKWLKTIDQQNKKIRFFPVPDACYIDPAVNPTAEIWPHLAPMKQGFDNNEMMAYLKSRRTFATNSTTGFVLHEATFTDKSRGESYRCCFSADHEEKSKEIVQRIKDMHNGLPIWQQQMNPIVKSTEQTIIWAGGARVDAFSSDPERYRSGGYTRIVPDEFAFHNDSERALTAILGSDAHRVVLISTPNGKNNAYYSYVAGKRTPNPNVFKIHWRMIPGRDDAWKAKLMREKGWTDADWAREMEFSFEVVYGAAMFEGFDYTAHVKSLPHHFPDDLIEGWCGWDIGTEYAAAVLCYDGPHEQLIVHTPIVQWRQEGGFRAFVRRVKEYRSGLFKRDRWRDITPHDTAQTSVESGRTYEQVFNDEGIYPEINPSKKPELGFETMRQLLPLRHDGRPGMIINEAGTWPVASPQSPTPEWRNIILEGFQGAFVRDQEKNKADGSIQYVDKPARIRPFIDAFDALNCLISFKYRDRIPGGEGKDEPSGAIWQPDI